jgi:hypothetical protein
VIGGLGIVLFLAFPARADIPPPPPSAAQLSTVAAQKLSLRNNAASLLAQLLDDEKGLHYVLLVKGHRAELQQLVQKISDTAAAAARTLADLAKADATLNLKAIELPPGEKATRAAIQSTKEKDLLFSAGANFEFNLLLMQTDALSYAWHLAAIAADNASDPAEAKSFTTISKSFEDLYDQAVALMRAPPAK